MKILSLMVTAVLLSACDAPQNQQIVPTPSKDSKSTTPISNPTDSGSSHPQLRVVFDTENNFDGAGLANLEKARSLLERVVNSDEFKQKILNFTYAGAQAFVQNDGMTNQQIYDTIMAGAEQFPARTGVDHTMNLNVERYYESSTTIGYTNTSTKIVYMNGNFFDDFTVSQIADNLMHEWLHKLGFDHDFDVTSRRPYSVPYAIGYIARDMVAGLM